jgi:hypothetical protein
MTRIAAWLVLLGAGITMASFQMWHALHSGMPLYLALLTGVVPVLIAMGLSHVVAHSQAGWFLKTVTFLVMLGAMVLSVRATGYVVRLAFGDMWPLFGAVVDSAALVALQAILTSRPEITAGIAAEPVAGIAAGIAPEPAGVSPEVPRRVSAAVSVHVSDDPEAKAARAAYRASVKAGRPLSQKALGAKYGKSQTWGRNRIGEVTAGPASVAAAR